MIYFKNGDGTLKKSGIKNILITGGSGKVGKAVIPQLLQAGYKLRAIQLREESVDVDGVETITGTPWGVFIIHPQAKCHR